MQNSLPEAKKRLLVNVGTNIAVVFFTALINIWLTPYLIKHLGLMVYGMIPLVNSVVQYFNLFTRSIAGAVSRFVAIYIGRGEVEQSNKYYNSAFFALLGICGVTAVPVIVLSIFFSSIFQVPKHYETSTNWLFFYIILSSFTFAISSPFVVSTFVKHRFDLSNLVTVLSRFLRVLLVVLLFTYLSPRLQYFGLSYCAMALFYLVCFIMLTKWLTPQLRISSKSFSWSAAREMGHMTSWMTLDQASVLLYIGIGFILINLFLGPEQVGRYGPIAQWVTLLLALGAALSNVFTPIAFEYIAQKRIDALALQMRRSTKFLGLIMGLPIGLLCGLSTPLLERWLGEDFADLGPLMWLLIGPWIITITFKPVFSIYRGLNRVKLPAIVAFAIGLVNVVLTILLLNYTDLGIYGVALSLMLCLVGKDLFFTPVYASIITDQPKTIFIREIIPSLIMTAILSLGALALSLKYDLASIPSLLIVSAVLSAIYVPLCYFVVMNKEERELLISLILRR